MAEVQARQLHIDVHPLDVKRVQISDSARHGIWSAVFRLRASFRDRDHRPQPGTCER
jgi:hypothetical protein